MDIIKLNSNGNSDDDLEFWLQWGHGLCTMFVNLTWAISSCWIWRPNRDWTLCGILDVLSIFFNASLHSEKVWLL